MGLHNYDFSNKETRLTRPEMKQNETHSNGLNISGTK